MGGKRRPRLTARTADRYDLYQRSVQSADLDARFLDRRFRILTGRPLRRFREDFCGTAILACEFVKLHRANRAIGIDLNRQALGWCRRRNLPLLTDDQRRRLTLLRRNVLHVRRPRVDLIVALNFSYSVFRTRPGMLAYLRNARRSVVPGGMFILDAFGGSAAHRELLERTRMRGFTYVWDQASFDPITHHCVFKIHYAFPDGSEMRNAFAYHWRLWTLPELRELMAEAGLRDVHVLWEGTDRETHRGNDVYRRSTRGTADPAWVAYVVGRA